MKFIKVENWDLFASLAEEEDEQRNSLTFELVEDTNNENNN